MIVDAITGSMLVGARHIEVECSDVHTAEAAAVLLGLARVRGFVEFTGGSFSVQGLGAEPASAWRTLEP